MKKKIDKEKILEIMEEIEELQRSITFSEWWELKKRIKEY